MRRQRRTQRHTDEDDYHITTTSYQTIAHDNINNDIDEFMSMERLSSTKSNRFENTIEAKVQPGDTLQALALRFHCKVADIKRLNKIDKDNEIFARKVVKIPINEHSILLETLPIVHKSGNNSPKYATKFADDVASNITCNPLEDGRITLSEKLLVASVNAGGAQASLNNNGTLNNTNINRKVTGNTKVNADNYTLADTSNLIDTTAPLLDGYLDDDYMPRLRPIRGPSLRAIDWSGSDCDMSWVCLFVVILALCFVIPLIYVIYIAEHTHHHNSTSSH